MTCQVRNLSVLNYVQGFTLWHYKAGNNTLAEVTSPNFFNTANALFSPCDMVIVSAADGGRILFVTAVSKEGWVKMTGLS